MSFFRRNNRDNHQDEGWDGPNPGNGQSSGNDSGFHITSGDMLDTVSYINMSATPQWTVDTIANSRIDVVSQIKCINCLDRAAEYVYNGSSLCRDCLDQERMED
jgi:hypothetical protein